MSRHLVNFGLLTLLFAAVDTAGAVDVYSTGFEQPTFTDGQQLQGSDGWTSAASLPPFLSTTAATITSAKSAAGTQSVIIPGSAMTTAVETDPYAAVASLRRPVNYDAIGSGNKIVIVAADVFTSGPAIGFSSFASAVAARDAAGFSVGELELGSDGSWGAFDGDDAPGTAPSLSGVVTPNAWHHVALTVDYNTSQTFFSIDNVQVGSLPFAGGAASGVLARGALVTYARPDVAGQFNRADYASYYDNFSITAVPEPSSLVLLGALSMPMFSLIRRRDRK